MFIKQLDNFVRHAVSASRVLPQDRRLGQDRRQLQGTASQSERRGGEERRDILQVYGVN